MSRSPRGRPAEILLVEDSKADARYLQETFKDAKLRNVLHHVPDAEAALALLESGPGRPDLILLDTRLPGMQGPELAAAIRSDARFASIPVVMLAASDLHAERLRETFGETFRHCLLKPIAVNALLALVAGIDSLAVALVTDAEGEAA
jgi:CheY-like chemotaxis protein